MLPQRILAFGGLTLICLGIIFGFIDLTIIEKRYFNARLDNLLLAGEYIDKGQLKQALDYLYNFEKINYSFYKLLDANLHLFIHGMMAILFAYLLPQIALNQKLLLFLAILIICGGPLFVIGTILSAYGISLGFYIVLLGGSWIFIPVISLLLGYTLGIKK